MTDLQQGLHPRAGLCSGDSSIQHGDKLRSVVDGLGGPTWQLVGSGREQVGRDGFHRGQHAARGVGRQREKRRQQTQRLDARLRRLRLLFRVPAPEQQYQLIN